ncbi:MAG: translocation/assembly module TamB domain-containing protein [Cyanobacteriota bacterium]|nr:translocation/assembly module TamB domain-containing protein [Cyanobacteriota bacterium]
MTNTPQDPQDKSTRPRRRWRRILVYSGLGLGTVTIAGGVALVSWIKTELAPMVETSLTNLLQRPVKVGQLESVGIGYLEFGPSLVPETATNPDFATTEAVEVRFPLGPLLSRTLKLNVTLVDVEAYIQQREDGSFEAPQIAAGGPSPINIEVESLQTPGLKAVILPMRQLGGEAASPIPVTLENAIIETKDGQQRISANLDGSFDNGGSFKLAVDSEPAKKYTTLAAEGNDLKIPELAQLIANPAIQLPAGEATGKVSMEIIDEEVQNANGSLDLKGVRANLEGLTKPILASGSARLIGNRAIADNLAVNYGAIATKIDGEAQFGPNYDLNRASFDLNAELAPAEIDALLNAARDEIDLQLKNAAENNAPETQQQLREVAANLQNLKSLLDGEVTAKVAITGNMPSPTISGKIETGSYTQIDRVGFNQIATNFQFVPQFDPQFQLVAAGISFSDLIIKPTIGGEIKGSGLYELIPDRSNLESSSATQLKWWADAGTRFRGDALPWGRGDALPCQCYPAFYLGAAGARTAHRRHPTALLVQSPPQTPDIQLPEELNIDLEIKDLPVGEFARLYGVISPLPLGNLSATAKVAGPVQDIDGQILWALSGGIYPAEGIVNVRNSQATIEKAIVQIGSGNLQLDGFANLENWQVTATANRIPLAALKPLEPLGLPPGLEGIANGQFRLAGPTDNFSPRAIAGNGSATLDVAGGTASVTGKLDRGLWQANANLSQLELSELERIAANAGFLETGRETGKMPVLRGDLFDRGDGSLNFRGDFTGNVDNLTQINGNSTAAIITPGGTINANANINSGLVRATIDTNKLALNPLIDLGISAVDSAARNELKEQTDKLKSVRPELTSRVNISGDLANLAPDSIDANLKANLQIDEGAIATDATLNSGNFRANLDTSSLALSDVEEILKKTGFLPLGTVLLPQEIDGQIEGGARISGNINNLTAAGIDLDGDAKLNIAGGTINATARANSGRFQASVNTSEIAVNPLLALIEEIVDSEAVVLDRNQVNSFKQQLPIIGALNSTLELSASARGNLNNLTPAAINGNLDAAVKIDEKAIEARGSLNSGQFDIFLESDRIALSSLEQTVRKTGVTELPQELTLPNGIDGDIDLNGRVRGNLENLSPEAIAANLEANLRVGDNRANAAANLNYGILEAQLNAEPIPLSYIEEIGGELGLIPPSLLPLGIDGEIEAGGSISGTLAEAMGGAISGNLTGQVRLDEGGAIDLLANLQGEGWEASVISDRLALSQFSELIEKQEAAAAAVSGIQQARTFLGQPENAPIPNGFLDGRVNLRGSSITNFSPEAIKGTGNLAISELPVLLQPFETAFNWNGDRLEIEKATTPGLFARGTVDVDFPGETTEISNIDLDVNMSDFDLESLPQQKVLNTDSVEQARRLLTGVVNFDGKIAGNLDNLTLAGDLSLENLAVNQIAFDPLLAGNFNLGLNEGLDLQLAGERDRIEVALDEEFFPSSFLISRDDAVARGITRGDDLEVYLDDFPLQALQIVPLPNIGIVSGITSAELTVFNVKSFDLESIRAAGNVTINDPAVGYIDGEIFTAEINYANGVGVLSDGKFILGESEYLLDARTDLNLDNEGGEFNPEFTASLRVKDGKTQDILTALKWFSIEEITQQAANGFEAPVYGNAEDLPTASIGSIVGSKGASLLLQLRRFVEIQALLARQELLREEAYPVVVPPLSELSATFSATIDASGSLQSGVKGDFNIVGDDWRWGIYSVDSFLLEGTYENEVLTVLPLRVETEGGLLSFSGVVGSENVSGQLRVETLSLEELQKFVKDLPREIVDVKGELNAEATFAGSLANPRAIGDINITNGTINDQPIKEAQIGFSYNNARLNFGGDAVVTGEEPILFLGTIPYQLPFASVSPDSEVINISMELKNEALKIVNLFTDQITVEDATAEIGLLVGGTLAEPEAQGKATITDMTVKAATFPDPLTDIEGSVLFRGDRLLVESLTGSLSDGEVTVTGVLPIVSPLAPGDPDIEKPLAIALEELKIDYEKFFQGDIDGEVIITGAALSPIIGGDIEVSDGRVLLNEAAGFASQFSSEEETPILPTGEQFEIRLRDLEVNLANRLRMVSLGLANFQAIGSLVLNGTATDPAPSGEIDLVGGTINLFSTDLRLDRDYENTAIFQPSLGLNPLVDLRLEASVLETNRLKAPTAALSSEIADTPIQGGLGSSRKIEVVATVRGPLTEAQDNLELTSSPQRTESQIIALLGGSIVDTFRDDSTLALANIASTTLFSSLEQDVLDATGLSEFRIFPARSTQRGSQRASELGVGLEVGLDLTKRLGASVTQVFASNAPTEFSLRYSLSDNVTLRGGTNFQDNSVFSVEYEVQF